MSGHERPEGTPDGTVCECSHRVYDHGRRKPPGSPQWEYVGCRVCGCAKFKAQDGSGFPYGVGP